MESGEGKKAQARFFYSRNICDKKKFTDESIHILLYYTYKARNKLNFVIFKLGRSFC